MPERPILSDQQFDELKRLLGQVTPDKLPVVIPPSRELPGSFSLIEQQALYDNHLLRQEQIKSMRLVRRGASWYIGYRIFRWGFRATMLLVLFLIILGALGG